MLFGDLIEDVREAVTDQPPSQLVPLLGSLTPVNTPGANVTPVNTPLYIVLTGINQWGETIASNELSVTVVPPNNSILIIFNGVSGFGTKFNLYIGQQPGAESFKVPFTATTVGGTLQYTYLGTEADSQAYPPQRNTAYLPDLDGDAISAGTMFRWLNRALELASTVAGGLLDWGGIASITGSQQYIAPGTWRRLTSVWYDGYPLAMDDSGNYFRRNPITASVLASVSCAMQIDRMMLELWPQPSRTAAATTLNAQLAANGTQASCANTFGFLLTNGMALIGGTEIVSYSGNIGGQLKNLQRGLGGSTAQLWPTNTPVQELNLFWSGLRNYAPAFVPGNSLLNLPVPVEWNAFIFEYALGRAKLAEQNLKDYSQLEDSFMKHMGDWNRANRVTVGPRQVGDPSNSLEVWPNFGGGFVIP